MSKEEFVTIDDALRVLAHAKERIGGDKCLILCLAGSELEHAGVKQFTIVDDRPSGGESTYVQVLVAHAGPQGVGSQEIKCVVSCRNASWHP